MSEITKATGSEVIIYNPDRGLQTIATAQAAELHWKRAKDPKKLYKAVETKLREQAAYVVWRDGVVPQGRPKKDFSAEIVLPEADPGALVAHRWRRSLCVRDETTTRVDHDKLRQAFDEAALRCQRVCEMESKGTERGTAGTGEFERFTPARYIEAARAVLGEIDLDPASNKIAQKTVRAKKFFTIEEDGLAQDWHGKVFLNPPYHRTLQPLFVDKLTAELQAERIEQAIMLTNNSTDTEWFRKAAEMSSAMCFTFGRINFILPSGGEVGPTQGQTFFYYGNQAERFAKVFASIGFGVTLSWRYGNGDKAS